MAKNFPSPPFKQTADSFETERGRWFSEVYKYLIGNMTQASVLPISAFTLDTVSPPTLAAVNSGNVAGLSFASGNTVYFSVEIPYYYVPNTNIQVFLNFQPTTSNNGVAKMKLEYALLKSDEIVSSETTIQKDVDITASGWYYKSVQLPDILAANFVYQNRLLCKLSREADSFTGGVIIHSIDFKIVTNFAR